MATAEKPDGDLLSRKIRYRNPFATLSLPFLAVLHRAAVRKRRRVARELVGKPIKKLHNWLRGPIGLTGQGLISVEVDGVPKPVPFNARNTQFCAVYFDVFANGYEPETGALLEVLAGDDGVFYDIGANWGYFSLYIAGRAGFKGRIHAFEPFPPTYADLRKTIEAAGLGDKIVCHDVALSDQAGEAVMTLPDSVHSGLARLSASSKQGDARVAVQRLDDFDGPTPTVLKIDAEDMEAAVLKGAARILREARPHVVFENWKSPHNPETAFEPMRLLQQAGYRLFVVGWRQEAPSAQFIVTDLPDGDADGWRYLALCEFAPAQRFLLPDPLNLLAVHEARMDDLKALFAD